MHRDSAVIGQLARWWPIIVASLMLLFATIMCNEAANLRPPRVACIQLCNYYMTFI